jgi:RNA polymerase sigma factor (sigma-70 family)
MTVAPSPQTHSRPARGWLASGRISRLSRISRLVESAAAGDQHSWDALVREFGGMVWAVARSYRVPDADAADVVQATWLALLEHITKLNDPARVGPWLATTARREALRALRHRKRHVLYSEDVPGHESSTEESSGQGLLIAERDRALWEGFGRLRPSDRALLRLLIADPRPAYEEISAALDIPIGSIGPTRARASQRLRAELDSDGALALMS